MVDSYVYLITALLPLAALTLVVQVNPYHALVIRGILGAVAALVYTVLGAADVALTEALVGTLLAVMLYAVAVRSSLVLRLGILKNDRVGQKKTSRTTAGGARVPGRHPIDPLVDELKTLFRKRHMRVEVVYFRNIKALEQALEDKKIHAICISAPPQGPSIPADGPQPPTYHTTVRLRRLYDILQTEHASLGMNLSYASGSEKRHS